MIKYVTKDQMKDIDRFSIKSGGMTASKLMEKAGRAIADETIKVLKGGGRVAVFCGYGNNGGDGVVAARHLASKGYDVKLYFVGPPKSFSPQSNEHLELLFTSGVRPEIIINGEQAAELFKRIGKPDLVIDAIFGIGVKDPLGEFYIGLIDNINELGSYVISADIPSGLDADAGIPVGRAVKASATVTMGYPKTGFRNPAAKAYIGKLVVADIGLIQPEKLPLDTPRKIGDKTVTLRAGRKGRLRPGHPWIYRGQILTVSPAVSPGDIVKVVNPEGKQVGRGYYNPRSEISVRMLSFIDEPIDDGFFAKKIADSVVKRAALSGKTDAYRAVFSEADGLPGLIVDVYADTAVFQVLTLGMERFKPSIIKNIKEIISPKYIYERSESPFRELEGMKDVSLWHGEEGRAIIEIYEGKTKFLVDIVNGHKTGFYLDQRRSRLALESFSKGRKVLDLFCYTGGFSVTAAANGALNVRGVDIKEDWLKLARENAVLNGVSDKTEFVKGDCFSVLRQIYEAGEKFDMIVIDPPSFTRTKMSVQAAAKGYKDLNLTAMKSLSEGGILCTFSCSHNIPNETFSGVLKRAAFDAGKAFTILKRCHQAEDHPMIKVIPETEYLKGYFLKVNSL